VEIEIENLYKVTKPNFKDFSYDMLLTTCILSGCDYLDSVKGIGFKKAAKIVSEWGNDTVSSFLIVISSMPL